MPTPRHAPRGRDEDGREGVVRSVPLRGCMSRLRRSFACIPVCPLHTRADGVEHESGVVLVCDYAACQRFKSVPLLLMVFQ